LNAARIETETYRNTEGTSKEYWHDLEVIKQRQDFVQQNLNRLIKKLNTFHISPKTKYAILLLRHEIQFIDSQNSRLLPYFF